ncbi:MAG: hypothetical protein ACP5PT_02300 [Brevinematia bacterium]
MKQLLIFIPFLWFINISYSQDIGYLKYYFYIFGIRAGEADLKITNSQDYIFITSKVKTYPGLTLIVNVDDKVVSKVDKEFLKTLQRDTVSVGKSFRDTNTVIFDREKGLIFIDSLSFGTITFSNTNDTINDLATEVLRTMNWSKLPEKLTLNFLEITNTRYITLIKQKGLKYKIQEIKDAYIELTNINNKFVFYKAQIPVFYIFPFGNIGLYTELADFSFNSKN